MDVVPKRSRGIIHDYQGNNIVHSRESMKNVFLGVLVRSDTRPDRPASVDGMVRETKEGPQLLRTTSDPGCCMRQRVGSEVLPMVHTMMKAEDPHAGEVEVRLV